MLRPSKSRIPCPSQLPQRARSSGRGLHNSSQDRQNPLETQLDIAGTTLPDDQKFIDEQITKLDSAGLRQKYRIRQNISREEKIEHLRGLTVLSVPVRYPEVRFVYNRGHGCWWSPIVQPNHGAFPEIIEHTGGGATYNSNNPEALADASKALAQ